MKKIIASRARCLQKRGAGVSMSAGTALPYPVKELARIKDISGEAGAVLELLDFTKNHPVTVTCRRFGISRSTYYRWWKRFDPRNLKSLENRSRRPKNVRKLKW